MMEEKELIRKIKELKNIRPEKNWVFLTKKEIFGETEFFPFFKPAYAGLFLIFLLVGLFGISQKSLPGEPLYYIKKIGERVEIFLLPEKERPKVNLEIASKRLEELSEIAKKNEVKKLIPAIKETKESIAQATENLLKLEKVDKEIAQKVLEIEIKKNEVEKILGIKIGEEKTEDPTKIIAQSLIEDFEKRSLNEGQKETLEKAKEFFENEEYSKVLEILLLIQ